MYDESLLLYKLILFNYCIDLGFYNSSSLDPKLDFLCRYLVFSTSINLEDYKPY